MNYKLEDSRKLLYASQHTDRFNLQRLRVRFILIRDIRNKQESIIQPDEKINTNDEVESFQQIKCDICFGCDSEEEVDEIVLCDLCNVAVHQSCYKRNLSDKVPKGDWFCE